MQMPLKIRFHGFPTSDAVEQDVRRRVEALEKTFPRVVSCNVSIELPHHHQRQGCAYRVQVDLGIPGRHLVAGGSPDDDPTHQDVYVAIRDAFRAAERQLQGHMAAMGH
jgi:ribosome-associated translation inhibitor RaiA